MATANTKGTAAGPNTDYHVFVDAVSGERPDGPRSAYAILIARDNQQIDFVQATAGASREDALAEGFAQAVEMVARKPTRVTIHGHCPLLLSASSAVLPSDVGAVLKVKHAWAAAVKTRGGLISMRVVPISAPAATATLPTATDQRVAAGLARVRDLAHVTAFPEDIWPPAIPAVVPVVPDVVKPAVTKLLIVSGSRYTGKELSSEKWGRHLVERAIAALSADDTVLSTGDEGPATWAREAALARGLTVVEFRVSGFRWLDGLETGERWYDRSTTDRNIALRWMYFRNELMVAAAEKARAAGWETAGIAICVPWSVMNISEHMAEFGQKAGVRFSKHLFGESARVDEDGKNRVMR